MSRTRNLRSLRQSNKHEHTRHSREFPKADTALLSASVNGKAKHRRIYCMSMDARLQGFKLCYTGGDIEIEVSNLSSSQESGVLDTVG